MGRVRVGVVGAGIIAQVMHLNYLRELSDRYEVVGLCDVVAENATDVAAIYGIERTFTDWHDLLASGIDAVIVLTSGSHADIAIAAAGAGIHVLVEKPMCFTAAEGEAMIAAADSAGVVLMVAYPKRYDPAFAAFAEHVATMGPRLMRVTTLESPFFPYVTHYQLAGGHRPDEETAARLAGENQAAYRAAIGTDDPELVRIYSSILVDSLVHELNTVRGALGEPTVLEHVAAEATSLTVLLRFGDVPVTINWVDLQDGFTRYLMEFACYGKDSRATLSFPSPFLRSAPTLLTIESGEDGTTTSRASEQITSYEAAFKAELVAFHASVADGAPVLTSGADGLADIRLCQAIIECLRTGQPIDHPTSPRH